MRRNEIDTSGIRLEEGEKMQLVQVVRLGSEKKEEGEKAPIQACYVCKMGFRRTLLFKPVGWPDNLARCAVCFMNSMLHRLQADFDK